MSKSLFVLMHCDVVGAVDVQRQDIRGNLRGTGRKGDLDGRYTEDETRRYTEDETRDQNANHQTTNQNAHHSVDIVSQNTYNPGKSEPGALDTKENPGSTFVESEAKGMLDVAKDSDAGNGYRDVTAMDPTQVQTSTTGTPVAAVDQGKVPAHPVGVPANSNGPKHANQLTHWSQQTTRTAPSLEYTPGMGSEGVTGMVVRSMKMPLSIEVQQRPSPNHLPIAFQPPRHPSTPAVAVAEVDGTGSPTGTPPGELQMQAAAVSQSASPPVAMSPGTAAVALQAHRDVADAGGIPGVTQNPSIVIPAGQPSGAAWQQAIPDVDMSQQAQLTVTPSVSEPQAAGNLPLGPATGHDFPPGGRVEMMDRGVHTEALPSPPPQHHVPKPEPKQEFIELKQQHHQSALDLSFNLFDTHNFDSIGRNYLRNGGYGSPQYGHGFTGYIGPRFTKVLDNEAGCREFQDSEHCGTRMTGLMSRRDLGELCRHTDASSPLPGKQLYKPILISQNLKDLYEKMQKEENFSGSRRDILHEVVKRLNSMLRHQGWPRLDPASIAVPQGCLLYHDDQCEGIQLHPPYRDEPDVGILKLRPKMCEGRVYESIKDAHFWYCGARYFAKLHDLSYFPRGNIDRDPCSKLVVHAKEANDLVLVSLLIHPTTILYVIKRVSNALEQSAAHFVTAAGGKVTAQLSSTLQAAHAEVYIGASNLIHFHAGGTSTSEVDAGYFQNASAMRPGLLWSFHTMPEFQVVGELGKDYVGYLYVYNLRGHPHHIHRVPQVCSPLTFASDILDDFLRRHPNSGFGKVNGADEEDYIRRVTPPVKLVDSPAYCEDHRRALYHWPHVSEVAYRLVGHNCQDFVLELLLMLTENWSRQQVVNKRWLEDSERACYDDCAGSPCDPLEEQQVQPGVSGMSTGHGNRP